MIKIFPMPKIEFHKNGIAYCLGYAFYSETIGTHKYVTVKHGSANEGYPLMEKNFEEFVKEFLLVKVKENFEPIVVPERVTSLDYMDVGFNSAISKLLELNPNAIKVEEW